MQSFKVCNNKYEALPLRKTHGSRDSTYSREVLPNGLTVISEQMQHLRSVSIGVWVKTGSRDEDPRSNGISHFIEHMLFKGSANRSAEDIARQVDSIGGNMDAFTARNAHVST